MFDEMQDVWVMNVVFDMWVWPWNESWLVFRSRRIGLLRYEDFLNQAWQSWDCNAFRQSCHWPSRYIARQLLPWDGERIVEPSTSSPPAWFSRFAAPVIQRRINVNLLFDIDGECVLQQTFIDMKLWFSIQILHFQAHVHLEKHVVQLITVLLLLWFQVCGLLGDRKQFDLQLLLHCHCFCQLCLHAKWSV